MERHWGNCPNIRYMSCTIDNVGTLLAKLARLVSSNRFVDHTRIGMLPGVGPNTGLHKGSLEPPRGGGMKRTAGLKQGSLNSAVFLT